MNKAPVSRREFLLGLLKTRVAIALLTVLGLALGYMVWQWRTGISSVAAILAVLFLVIFLAGLIPMAIGFVVQLFVRRPVPALSMWTIAAGLTGAAVVLGGLPHTQEVPASVSWGFLMVSCLATVSFLQTGAGFCRRCVSKYRRRAD